MTRSPWVSVKHSIGRGKGKSSLLSHILLRLLISVRRGQLSAKSYYRKGDSRNNIRIRYRDNIASQSEAAREGLYATSSDESLEQEDDAEHKALKGVAPDADITYSFDVARGANATAREALPQALERAIERWETGVTEKLIKDEYEVVPPETLEGAKKSREEEAMDPSKEEEDGFEFI